MPYLNDPRRTVTVNLDPADYDDLAEDAGYASAGTYAKALVLHRGEAPPPLMDRRSRERCARNCSPPASPPGWTPARPGSPAPRAPRSRPAQDRAVAAAVATARARDATKMAALQARCAALTARLAATGNG